jgi:ligand-binding sensor domain-containing protein/two-component sensor histidine kinase
MTGRKLILTVVLGFFASSLTAQHFIFKTYTVEDGLVSNPVRRIFQDSKGFIWIATWEGLSRYDGNKFTNYTIANGLSHNMVNDMFESADGKMYIAENNGVIDILQQNVIVKRAAFQPVVINQFYKTPDQRVFAATDTNGLYEIKNGDFVKPLQSIPGWTYNDLIQMNDSLLIGGCNGSLLLLTGKLELFSEIKQSKDLLTFKIFKDSKNRIWIGTNNGLKLISQGENYHHIVEYAVLPSPFHIPQLNKGNVNDMLEDENGKFWIATANGLVVVDPDGRSQLFTEKDGLPSPNISCIYGDKEKNIWIGTALGVAKLVTKNNIRIYFKSNELKSNNFLLPLKNGSYITRTETGLQLYDPGRDLFIPLSPLSVSYTGFVQNSHPQIFYGENLKFGIFDSSRNRVVDYSLPAPPKTFIYNSIMDANGVIFTGTHTGLLISTTNKSWFAENFKIRINSLLIDKKGYLWIATWDQGLYRVQYTHAGNNINLSIENFSELLPDKSIRCLFEDSKENIWVGTRYQGVIELKNKNGKDFIVQQIDLRKGLMSNSVLAVSEDEKGNVWIGSDLGIDKLIPMGPSFRVFNFSRVNNYFGAINAILPEKDHSFWFATDKGLVNIIDGEMEKTTAETVRLTSVNLGDTSFNFNKHTEGTNVLLKYYQNQAKFEFSAPEFINEKQILYSYRLTGSADTGWNEPSNLHNASYSSLQPGNYRFEVRTLGWNGEWGKPTDFLFTIRPPYWQTWWFYSLVGLFIGFLFYAFYLYRIRQFVNLQNVRNRIATDLHDDIGATLTNINMLSEISRKNLEQPKEAEKFLYRITEEVTSSSQALNDIIWSVNSLNDSMEAILLRMRRYAAELFDNSKTSFHIDLDEMVAEKKINMEQRRDVYLIYKESMNNIFKHASANNVWINMQWGKNKLYLNIRDDGKGFDSSIVTSRNGLRNIHFRTEKWRGTALIKTSPGNGTRIEIVLPVQG